MLLRQGAVQQVQQRSSPTQQQQLRWQHQAAAPRPGRSRAVACVARRTVSGSDAGRSALKRPGSKPSSTPDSKKQPPPQQPAKRQPPASQNGRSSGAQSKQQQQQQSQNAGAGLSDLEVFMRTTPGFNRFLDGLLILGDAVMVLATELSSERLPLEQLPALASVAVLSWVVAGAALGDYMARPDPDANPLSDALGWPIFAAIVNAMITWAVALVVSLLGYSWLVSSFVVDPAMVMEVPHDGELSPQLEVSVALLITMSCWRGTAARLRL